VLSAAGRRFNQAEALRLSKAEQVILVCGRYEGIDERVVEHLATAEISIGDFIVSGGEIAAAVVVDAVTRYVPEWWEGRVDIA
jgi:tRNA (guanine37-N1)-methyltransferase